MWNTLSSSSWHATTSSFTKKVDPPFLLGESDHVEWNQNTNMITKLGIIEPEYNYDDKAGFHLL